MSPSTSSVMFFNLLLILLKHNFVCDKHSYKLLAIIAALDTLTQFLHMQFHVTAEAISSAASSVKLLSLIYRFINNEIFSTIFAIPSLVLKDGLNQV